MALLIFAILLGSAFSLTPAKAADAVIWTDKEDYSPGETVTIHGSGFLPDSVITVEVTAPDPDYDRVLCTNSDSEGNFEATYGQPPPLIMGTYNVVATDGTNTATTTFTDSIGIDSVTIGSQSPSPVTAGSSATYSITSTWKGGGTSNTATLSITIWTPSQPSGLTITFTPASLTSSVTTSTLTIGTSSSTPAGTYTFTVDAYDTSSHKTATQTLVVSAPSDTTPPTVSISSPSNGAYLKTAAVAVSGASSDSGSGVAKVEVKVDSGSYALATGTTSWSYTTASLGDGSHTITAKATDNSENWAETSVSITVDTIAPVVTITAPAAGYYKTSTLPAAAYTATDTNPITVVESGY